MNAEQFITEKYESNNWGLYPPSRRLVTEWLQEYADQQLILSDVVKSFLCENEENKNPRCKEQCLTCNALMYKHI
jgi:hypothetical protein